MKERHVPVFPRQSWLSHIMAGSPLIPVGPRVGIRVENGSGSLDYFFFLPRGSMYVCVDTPACMFKQATSQPLGSLGLGVCTKGLFLPFGRCSQGYTGSRRGLELCGQGVLSCCRDLGPGLEVVL